MPLNSGNEAARLASLRTLEILDTEPEAEFESIVKAAAALCGMPISLISLVDENRQWFKANVGMASAGMAGVSETPRSVAFCSRTILQDDVLEIGDCATDSRFRENPLVTGTPELRFYAGVPLRLSDGSQVGSLCVMDQKPGKLTDSQRLALRHLSEVAVHTLESRRAYHHRVTNALRFRALCASLSVGVFATDTQGRDVYANDRLRQILGVHDGAESGQDYLRHLHPDDRELFEHSWREAADNELELEFRILRDDNTVGIAKMLSNPVIADGQSSIGRVGSVEDITLAREHMAEQNRTLALLHQTGSLAKVGGWELDVISEKLIWSEQTCLIFGVPTDHQPELDEALDYFAPESREEIVAALDRLSAGGPGYDLEVQLQRANGQRIWARVVGEADFEDGRVVRLLGAMQDIDDAVRQRLALENAHEKISMATEVAGIGVWEWDFDENQFSCTPLMLQLYGLPLSEVVLSVETWRQMLHPDDRARLSDYLQNALDGNDNFDTEFRIIRADGEVRQLHCRTAITRNKAGRLLTLMGVNWDITTVRQLTTQLAEQHKLLHVTLQSIDDAVITSDTEGLITWLNPAAETLTAWTCEEAVGQPLNLVYKVENETDGRSLESPVVECLRQGKPVNHLHDAVLVTRKRSRIAVEDSAAPIMDDDHKLLGVVLVFRDVSERRRLSLEMAHRASHDELTQIYNRSEFEVRLQRSLDDVHRVPASHALMFIDLDQFKLVNDACGHAVGDQLLRQIADVLTDTLRENDVLARLGGDEFGAILHDCGVEEARAIAQSVCRHVDEFRFSHNGRRYRIGASIGLVPLDGRWNDVLSIMQAADTSCYAAKEAGRNRVHVWFDSDQTLRARRGDMQWAARLEQSLDENCFELFAQKMVDLNNSAPGIAAEVLIRLRDDTGETILPAVFLSAAERFHLATRIDRWVLQQSIDTLQALPRLQDVDRLWINLSGQSVGDKEFHADAIQMLMNAGPEICQCLCLEITETAAVTNITDAARFIDRLRILGVTTALDDFGTGTSSFGHLKNLPVDVLKIDGQFISSIIDDPLDAATVRCFVDVATVVGLKTVAEHVDCPLVLERVKTMGFDYAQGFLLHEPEPIAHVLNMDDWQMLQHSG